MNQKTVLTVVAIAAAAGVAYYFYKKSAASPVPAPTGAGGGAGANASTAAAYNGVLNPTSVPGGVSWLSGIGASIGHLFDSSGNSTGGASLNTGTPLTVDQNANDSSVVDQFAAGEGDGYDYSLYE